jgi:dTDP-4-dehydrorhamnose reductase
MRIFVSGQEGQLARCLMAGAGNHEVICAGRPTFDFRNSEKVEQIVAQAKPDIIVNAAAYTAVDKAESEPELAMTINRDGAAAMARAAERLDVPLIQISTDYVFSGKKPTAYIETDETAPLNIYGASKLAGEQAVATLAKNYAILRTSWVYSSYGNNFVKTMLRLGAERPDLSIVADQWGCPTSADDLAAVVIKVANDLRRNSNLNGIYHVAGTGETNWADFAREIFNIASVHGKLLPTVKNITTADYPTPATRPLNSRLNCQKLFEVFGARLPAWQESLQRVIGQIVES